MLWLLHKVIHPGHDIVLVGPHSDLTVGVINPVTLVELLHIQRLPSSTSSKLCE